LKKKRNMYVYYKYKKFVFIRTSLSLSLSHARARACICTHVKKVRKNMFEISLTILQLPLWMKRREKKNENITFKEEGHEKGKKKRKTE